MKLRKKVDILLIYMDDCCYNRPYDDQSQIKIHLETQAKLEIQENIRAGKLKLATSYILEAENASNPFSTKRDDIQNFINAYTEVFIEENNDKIIREMAKSIMNTGIKFMDACHIACAVLAKCDAFLTTDKRVLKYTSKSILVTNPATFLVEGSEM